jgi:phosphohistidine swiveling domain-containing protein
MDLGLWQLAAQIRADTDAVVTVRDGDAADLAARYRAGTLPPGVQRGLETFLRRYGHRAVAEIDIGMPRWRDDPSHLLGVLANYLRLPPGAADPVSGFRRGAAEADAMIAALQNRARRRGRARAAAVGFSLRRTRQLAGLREMPKYLMVLALAGARAELVIIGQHLASAGQVAVADDVFFLDLREVRAALGGVDQRALVRGRRETYAQEMRRRRIPRLLLSDGTEPEAASEPAADGALRGTPASAGTVTAAARVVLDPAGAHLEPGEVLVAPSTDPGWTPLFLTAGGLVMEMGGANSHGAVVAREYGIPAVVGVPDATSRIATGQRVHVDGASGVVVPVDDQED